MSLADRAVKAFTNATVGTIIVLVHAVLANRETRRKAHPEQKARSE